MADQHRLPMWVVYNRPSDHPDKFVARLWYTLPQEEPTTQLLKADSLAELHHQIYQAMPGAIRLERMPDDDAKIMEVWL